MMRDGIVHGRAKEPSCKQVAEWLVDAHTYIPEQVSRNAWVMTGYAWFSLNFNNTSDKLIFLINLITICKYCFKFQLVVRI